MRIAIYSRVSTGHQVEHQTIEQQIARVTAHVGTHAAKDWTLDPAQVFRDDGYSGAALARPGLDRLRDAIKGREVDRVLVTAPDRLARNYVHQMVLLEEWAQVGCAAEFLDRPMSDDPHDHLLLQIRGAVAEYERTLIAERMRRGRLAKLRAGLLLPWTYPPSCNYPHLSTPNQRLARFVQIVSICAELFEGPPRQVTLSGSNIDRSRNYSGPCGWSEMWVIARSLPTHIIRSPATKGWPATN